MKTKMDYSDAIGLSKNLSGTIRGLRFINVLTIGFLPIVLVFYFYAFICILIRSLFYVAADEIIEHEPNNNYEMNNFHLSFVLFFRSIILFLLNIVIYCVGALYDIFKIILSLRVKDLYFFK